MTQVNIRIAKEDYRILELAAKEKDIPIATLFRSIVHTTFNEWKLNTLLELYKSGQLRFKDAWKLSKLSYLAFINLLAENEIEPPHTELMELNSAKTAKSLTREQILKDPNYKRKTPPLNFDPEN